MNYKTILSLDPSGNFHEGKGTTGWCLYDCAANRILDAGSISSKDYTAQEAYWWAHINLIDTIHPDAIVCEDYLVYADKASPQTYSRMETPKLIGVVQYIAWLYHYPFYLQRAVDVKTRWTNEILEHKGIIAHKGKSYSVPDNPAVHPTRHTIDAIRHAVHFATFKNGGTDKNESQT